MNFSRFTAYRFITSSWLADIISNQIFSLEFLYCFVEINFLDKYPVKSSGMLNSYLPNRVTVGQRILSGNDRDMVPASFYSNQKRSLNAWLATFSENEGN